MWIDLLRAAVARSTQAQVGKELNYSSTVISLVLAGKYSRSTEGIRTAVLAKYSQVDCPFLRGPIPAEDCRHHCSKPMPTNQPQAIRHWAACKICPLNPHAKGEGHASRKP